MIKTILIGTLFFLASCANTVSQQDPTYEIQFTIQFQGPVNLKNYNYYLVFQTASNIAIEPDQVVDLNGKTYFPTPGLPYNQETMGDQDGAEPDSTFISFYTTLFSTWSDYMVIQNNDNELSLENAIKLFRSGNTGFQRKLNSIDSTNNTYYLESTPFKNNQQYILTKSGNILTLTFDISTIGLNINDQFSFHLFTTKRISPGDSTDLAGHFLDYIQAPQSFDILLLNQQSNDETGNTPIDDPSGDIISWEVRVF